MSHILHALQNMVLRAKIMLARVNGRTLAQVSGLDEDTHDLVELLLPPFYVAVPREGADVLELRISGLGSHKVLIGGDNTADALANLQPGEGGLSSGGQLILIRLAGVRVVSPLFQWGTSESTLYRMINETFQSLFNEHTHNFSGGVTQAPNQQMPNSCLTGGS